MTQDIEEKNPVEIKTVEVTERKVKCQFYVTFMAAGHFGATTAFLFEDENLSLEWLRELLNRIAMDITKATRKITDPSTIVIFNLLPLEPNK